MRNAQEIKQIERAHGPADTLDHKPYRGPSLGPVWAGLECTTVILSLVASITLCMLYLRDRNRIRHRTAGPICGDLECTTVILITITLYFACRTLPTEPGFDTELRAQSGEARNAQLSSLPW